MRRVRGHRDSQSDSPRPVPSIQHTRLDGTPCDPSDLRLEYDSLARVFARAGVNLVTVERAVLALYPRIRDAKRAYTRLIRFEQECEAWKRVAPIQRALRRRGAPLAEIVALNRFRPSYFGADARGRYAWARRELQAEFRSAWPKSRRTDKLQTEIIATVRMSILRQVYPEYEPGRDVDRGIPAKVDRLTVKFLRVYFPFMSDGPTAHRLRNRPSLPRLLSN
jgi:hypothetical protein